MTQEKRSHERLDQVIQWAGLSTHAFAMYIGMKRSENLYRIIRNKENLSIKLAMQIINTFPEINRNWLIHGEGEMLIKTERATNATIPLYEDINIEPIYSISLPNIKDVDFAMTANDGAMEPTIGFGSTILIKKKSTSEIVYGRLYYVETNELKLARAIRKCDTDDTMVTLVPINIKEYDSMTIEKAKITALGIICMVINQIK